MRVLVIQNYDDTGLGQVGVALDEAGALVDLRAVHRGAALPATAADYEALVVLGGGQNALDDGSSHYFPALLELMREFASADKAVLGICLGGQLLARACGGENQIGGAEEFGWNRVALTEAAASDPVFRGLPAEFPVFQWHDDTFNLPVEAVRLASSAIAANQAFRIGRAGYGIQFHFEADTKLVRAWNVAFASTIADRYPDWEVRFEEEAERYGAVADALGLEIARAWIRTVRHDQMGDQEDVLDPQVQPSVA